MTATVRGISLDGREGTINQSGHRTFSVVYKVQTDDKRDGPGVVRVAPGIPSIGNTYTAGNDIDTSAVCVNKHPYPTDCPFEWLVECEFTTDPGAYEPQQFDNPLQQPPELTFGFQERRILIPGRFNNPIGPNSNKDWEAGIFAPNGELFDPQPETDIADPVWNIKKNVQNISYEAFMALANCVNADFFQGVEPRQLRFKPPSAVRKWHKNIGFYWEVAYQLVYRWETWDIQILNQGTYYFPTSTPSNWWGTTEARHIKVDTHGNRLVVNLTTAGNINNTATPTFTRIRFFREIQFGSLSLL